MTSKKMAISLNMDSLRHAVGNFPLQHDPFYFEALDRVLQIAGDRQIKLTIFVIGKDLVYPEIAQRVSELHDQGHEIANHTWSHPQDFGTLDDKVQLEEIRLCSLEIERATGVAPKGFLAPAWSANGKLNERLAFLGFSHDSSHFPSLFVLLLQIKLSLNFLIKFFQQRSLPNTYSFRSVFLRSDLLINLRMRSKPYRVKKDPSFVEIPLPLSAYGIPYWFTLEFFSKRLSNLVYNSILKRTYTYILIHPADFAKPSEIEIHSEGLIHSLERSRVEKDEFIRIFTKRLDQAIAAGYEFTTMSDIADSVRNSKS